MGLVFSDNIITSEQRKEFDMEKEICVHVIDFPSVEPKEIVTENDDGSFSIFLNAKQSSEQQVKSYEHALYHIESNDFGKDNVDEIEKDAH